MKTIIIIFIKSITIIILLYVLFNAIFYDLDDIIQIEFLKRIFYNSFIISFVLTSIHFLFAKIAGVSNNFSVNQNEVLKKVVELDDLKSKIKTSTKWNLIDKKDNLMNFKSSMSIKSFGEKITVSSDNGETIITSKPSFFAIFDFGKNYENIKLVSSLITS